MKVLLFLNGPESWQTGIEDGFSHLLATGVITDLKWSYMMEASKQIGAAKALEEALTVAEELQPDLIVIFHIGTFPITEEFIRRLKQIKSGPILAYDEGDMYGTWAKPMSGSMRLVAGLADVVSIRGLGAFHESVSKLNKRVIYTPHHSDIARFDKEPYLLPTRANQVVLIGNRIKPKLFGNIRRLPGAKARERFVKSIGAAFPDDFVLHGNGWDGFRGNQGPVDFQKQLDVYRNSWITVAYEHYPEIPYYFSNRLPLALLAGSLYVCHYHEGYDDIFKDCDFMFFFRTDREAVDTIKYILSLSKDDLLARSARAREFSLKNYHPNVVWRNFLENVKNSTAHEGQ
jgi:hypothetical protein